MLGSRKDQTPNDRPPLPRWLAWLLFGFILYVVVIGNISGRESPDPVPVEPSQIEQGSTRSSAPEYPAIRRTFDIHNWQRAFDPTLAKGLRVRDFTQGKGRPVACGDEVAVMLRGSDAKGKSFDEKHDETKPYRFTVGDGKAYKAVEQSVVGMRLAGERTADAPPVLVHGEGQAARNLSTLELRITLTELKPSFADDVPPLLVSGDPTAKGGAACGDVIPVEIRMWESGAEKPSKLAFEKLTLGARQLAIGLDYVLPGIKQGETRTVLLPAPYQMHTGNESPFDGKTMRIVEVTRK